MNFYTGHGHKLRYIRTDREPNLLSCEDFLLTLGIVMQHTGTNSHAKQAERAIQTLKSPCRATKCSLGFNLPQELHQYLIQDVVGALNDVTNTNCCPSTPNIPLTGARASCSKQYRAPFGTFGTVKTPPNREQDDLPRAVLAMCVGRDHSSHRSLKVWNLHSRQIIHVTSFTPLAITKDLITAMDNYCAQEPQIGDDPLADSGMWAHRTLLRPAWLTSPSTWTTTTTTVRSSTTASVLHLSHLCSDSLMPISS